MSVEGLQLPRVVEKCRAVLRPLLSGELLFQCREAMTKRAGGFEAFDATTLAGRVNDQNKFTMGLVVIRFQLELLTISLEYPDHSS